MATGREGRAPASVGWVGPCGDRVRCAARVPLARRAACLGDERRELLAAAARLAESRCGSGRTGCRCSGWVTWTPSTWSPRAWTAPASGRKRRGHRPESDGSGHAWLQVSADRRAHGIPFAASLAAANVHDSKQLLPLVDATPPIRRLTGQPGRPPFPSDEFAWRQGLRLPDPSPRPPRTRHRAPDRPAGRRVLGTPRPAPLGRGRTIAWLLCYRRLAVRYDRLATTVLGLLHPACSLVCARFLRRADRAAIGS